MLAFTDEWDNRLMVMNMYASHYGTHIMEMRRLLRWMFGL